MTDRTLESIPVDNIQPDNDQPRKHYSDESIADMAQTIHSNRLISPITVRPIDTPTGEPDYEITTGERRWLATQEAGESEIDAIVENISLKQKDDEQLIENIQRSDLLATELGEKIVRRFERDGIEYDSLEELASDCDSLYKYKKNNSLDDSHQDGSRYDKFRQLSEVLERIGVNGQRVARWIRNAAVSEHIKARQQEADISEDGNVVDSRTVADLSKIEDEDIRNRLYDKIQSDDLSRQAAKQLRMAVWGDAQVGDNCIEYLLSDESNIYDFKALRKVRTMDVADEESRLEVWKTIEDEEMNRNAVDEYIQSKEANEVDVSDDEDDTTEQTVEISVSESTAETIEETAEQEGTSTTEVVEQSVQTGNGDGGTVESMDLSVGSSNTGTDSHEAFVEGFDEGEDADWKFNEEIGMPVPEDEELADEFVERAETIDEQHEAILNHETTVELGDLKENWDAYGHAINHIHHAKCPECGNGIEHLTWDCHGDSVREAYEKSQEYYQQAIDEAPDLSEILEESEDVDAYSEKGMLSQDEDSEQGGDGG